MQCLVSEDSQPSPYPSPAPSLNHASLSTRTHLGEVTAFDSSQAKVIFEDYPLTLTTEHTWSWTQPPQGLFQWNTSEPSILAPLPLQPQELTPPAPSPPVNASPLANTQLGHFCEVPELIHVLKRVDLQAWDCNKACRLLDSRAPTTWAYTNGSAAPLCYGNATTLFPPTGPLESCAAARRTSLLKVPSIGQSALYCNGYMPSNNITVYVCSSITTRCTAHWHGRFVSAVTMSPSPLRHPCGPEFTVAS